MPTAKRRSRETLPAPAAMAAARMGASFCGSPAAAAGLRANDIITGANRARVANLKQLREAAKGAQSLVLSIRRGNAIVLVPLRQ